MKKVHIMNKIYSIEARDNLFLKVGKDCFYLTPKQMGEEVLNIFHLFIARLEKADINYTELKNALIPNKESNEYEFIFDTTRMGDSYLEENANYNMCGYNFNNYEIISIQGVLFNLFMSYKIDCMYPLFINIHKNDFEVLSNIITSETDNVLKNLNLVDKAKIKYIENEKKILTRLNVLGVSEDGFTDIIKQNIKNSAIYDIDYSSLNKYSIVKFTMFIDAKSEKNHKFKCVFGYQIDSNSISLITMY